MMNLISIWDEFKRIYRIKERHSFHGAIANPHRRREQDRGNWRISFIRIVVREKVLLVE